MAEEKEPIIVQSSADGRTYKAHPESLEDYAPPTIEGGDMLIVADAEGHTFKVNKADLAQYLALHPGTAVVENDDAATSPETEAAEAAIAANESDDKPSGRRGR